MRKRQQRKPHVTQRHKARSVGNAISIAPVPGSRSHRREVIGAGDLGAFQRFFQAGSYQMLLPQSCRLPGQRCGQHRCLRSAVVSTASLAELRFPVRLRQDLREAFADRRLPAWSYCSRPWCAKRTQGPKPQVLVVDAARTGTTPVFQPHMRKRHMRKPHMRKRQKWQPASLLLPGIIRPLRSLHAKS